ncbi:MAG: alpha/beta hydrolase fold domain-containing protein [Hyphomonadaceae bacterium]
MREVFPEPSDVELQQVRRVNRRLRWAPRFRAPTPLGRLAIQTMLSAHAIVPVGLRNVQVSTKRIRHDGHEVSLRILRPETGETRGVYIDYHGGGWSIGKAAMDDLVNGAIVRETGLAVVSVDYTTLPDISFLDQITQSCAAADWVFDNADAEFGARDLFIGGESAGAHLAACSLVRLRDKRADFARLRGAVLFYGPYDLSATQSVRNATRETLVLDGPAMTPGIAKLLPDRDEAARRAPDVSPLYADLSRLPPALLLCGRLDPLIDDSRLMSERWQAASGNARLILVPESPHAFNRLPTELAARTNRFVRGWLVRRMEARSPAVAAE